MALLISKLTTDKEKAMTHVQIYTKGYCPFCKKAKATLNDLGVNFEEFEITNDTKLTQEMQMRSNRKTVPQIFVGGQHLGGNDDLQASLNDGSFKKLLTAQTTAA
jgi:glutaredoxin 3